MTASTDDTESRLPNPITRVPALAEIGVALARATANAALPATTVSLAQLRVGHLVGSEYLVAFHAGGLRRAGEDEARIGAVSSWEDSSLFTEAERVALALADAVLTPASHGQRVTDALYERASSEYDDTALTTLILALGQVCFYLPLALIGKPLPGRAPAEQWRP